MTDEQNSEWATFEQMWIGNAVKILDSELAKIAPGMAMNAKWYVTLGPDMCDPLNQTLVLALKTWVLKSPHPARKISLHAPATGWDYLKQYFVRRVMPRWLKQRWWININYTTPTEYEYGPIYVCPHSTEKWPDGAPIHIRWLKDHE